MSYAVNSLQTNIVADRARMDAERFHATMSQSRLRLSSGIKTVGVLGDYCSFSILARMNAATRSSSIISQNAQNLLSYLQTQEGYLNTVKDIFLRLNEISMHIADSIKGTEQTQMYIEEFQQLTKACSAIVGDIPNNTGDYGGELYPDGYAGATFNGLVLFDTRGTPPPDFEVALTQDGSEKAYATVADFGDTLFTTIAAFSDTFENIVAQGVDNFRLAMDEISTMMATNGAQQERLVMALEAMGIHQANMEEATDKIQAVDVARETTKLSLVAMRFSIATTVMDQANVSSNYLLRLLKAG